MLCTLCGTTTTVFIECKEKLFYKCVTCDGILLDKNHYLDSNTEKQRYDKHSDNVEDKGYQRFVIPIVNAVIENYSISDKGLDYGCGKTAIIQHLLQQKGYIISGYDPFYYPSKKVLNEKYDYITCCEVVEHFYNPFEEFKKLSDLLCINGKLYLKTNLFKDTINFNSWWYKNDPTHVFFYSIKTLEYIKNKFNFSSLKITDSYIELKK